MLKKLGSKIIKLFSITVIMSLLFVMPAKAEGSDFANGADIGWVTQLEADGVTWVDDNGVQKDPFVLLKEKGINAVRLRVFVNPPQSAQWTKRDGTVCYLGYADTDSVISTAKRAQEHGMDIMVDFHYSDHFADPGYQDIPEAWVGHNYEQLKKDVYDFTYQVMDKLNQAGVTPKWVQVGNEINSGMLLPYGNSGNNFSQLVGFLNSGYDAVKAVSSSTKVITHLGGGEDNAVFRSFFDKFITTYKGKTDVIGMSYYPYWIGSDYTKSIDKVTANLQDMSTRYGKEVMICETGGFENEPITTYNILAAVKTAVKNVSQNKGIGVFYWEPAAHSSLLPDGYPLGACELVSPKTIRFTEAMNAFLEDADFPKAWVTYKIVNKNSNKAMNIKGGSKNDNIVIEQYGYGGWTSQDFQFIMMSDGYYKIMNVNSRKLLQIEGDSTEVGQSCVQNSNDKTWGQQWKLEKTPEGYILRNRKSNKVLGIKDGSVADGSICVQQEFDGSSNQVWFIDTIK